MLLRSLLGMLVVVTASSCAAAQEPAAPSKPTAVPVTAVAPTAATPAPTSPTPVPSTSPPLVFAFQNLSFFHQDGERLAVARDGRVVYESMRRGPLARRELVLDAGQREEIARVVARLRAERTSLVDRPGIPDEVRVKVQVTGLRGELVTHDLWEADIGKLAAGDVLADALRVARSVAAAAAKTAPRPATPGEAGATWPIFLETR